MLIYTFEVPEHERLKKLIELSLRCNGFDVSMNPTTHKLFDCQKNFDAPVQTVVMKTHKHYINWHRLVKFFINRENGYGRINLPNEVADKLIEELEFRLLMGGDNAKGEENKGSYKEEQV